MNKAELIKQLNKEIGEKLSELELLNEKIEREFTLFKAQLEKEREQQQNWRAEKKEKYLYVNDNGGVFYSIECASRLDHSRHKVGNYFRTEEEAKNSPYYFMLNSEYFYWFPDMPKPKELPKGCEFYFNSCWQEEKINTIDWSGYVRRYPKHKGGD